MRTLCNCPTSCETCLMWVLVEESSCSDWSALFWGGVFAPDMSFEGLVDSLTDFERSVAERTGLIDGHRVGICHYVLRTVSCDAGWRFSQSLLLCLPLLRYTGDHSWLHPIDYIKNGRYLQPVNRGVLHCRVRDRASPIE